MKTHIAISKSITFSVVAMFLCFFASMASSQPTFQINGSRHIVIAADKYQYPHNDIYRSVVIKKNIPGKLTLSAVEHFTNGGLHSDATSGVYLQDSNGASGGSLRVWYSANRADTTTGMITFYDGANTRDTVWITAYNSAYNNHDKPFTMIGGYTFNTANQHKDVTAFIVNLTQDALSMSASLDPSTGPFSLDKTSFIAPVATNTPLTITYTPSGNAVDIADLTITAEHKGLTYSLPLKVVSEDSLYHHTPSLICDSVKFIEQTMGTKECKEFVIKNPGKYDITITKADVYTNNPNDFTAEELKVPTTIPAGGELRLDICYTAPNEHNMYSVYDIQIEFENPAGVKGHYQYPTAFGSSPNCYTTQPVKNLLIPATMPGGYTERDFTFVNQLGEPIVISKLEFTGPDASEFSLINLPALPLAVPALGTKEFTVRYAPSHERNSATTVSFAIDGTTDKNCSEFGYIVYGMVRSEHEHDSEYYPLFGDVKETLPIKSTQNKVTKEFIFYNNQAASVKVLSVSVTDGTHFRIVSTDPSALPVTIGQGGKLKVLVEFDAGPGGIYNDELIIVTDNALTSLTFQMQGIRAVTASVDEASINAVELSVLPNPAASSVRITTTNAVIRETAIYDMLGNVVARITNTNNWTWDLHSTTGERVADGTYFIRTEGITASGSAFVKTEKMIVRK